MWYTNIAKFTTIWSEQVSNEMKQENLLNEMGFQNGDPPICISLVIRVFYSPQFHPRLLPLSVVSRKLRFLTANTSLYRSLQDVVYISPQIVSCLL